jgi:glycosyltransferase involved in cell wall biosynthesis
MMSSRPWLSVSGPVAPDDVADFLRTLDIYVLPARNLSDHEEHDAHALLQAMSVGLPCIGTTSGIVPEILGSDGKIGILVGDSSVDDLSSEIRKLALDVEARRRLGIEARARTLERYSLEYVAFGRLQAYKRVVKSLAGLRQQ